MKKLIIAAIVAAVVVTSVYSTYAQEHRGAEHRRHRWRQKKGYRGMRGMCPLHMALAKSLTDTQMAVTDDGKVIIMAGHKLMKYDKDLELVKTVDLEIDIEAARKKMEQIMEDCPKRKAMMRKEAEEAAHDK